MLSSKQMFTIGMHGCLSSGFIMIKVKLKNSDRVQDSFFFASIFSRIDSKKRRTIQYFTEVEKPEKEG